MQYLTIFIAIIITSIMSYFLHKLKIKDIENENKNLKSNQNDFLNEKENLNKILDEKNDELEKTKQEKENIKNEKQDLEIKYSKLEGEFYILKENQEKQEILFKEQQQKQEQWIKQQQESQKEIFKNISTSTLKEQNEIGKQQINDMLNPFKEQIEKCKNAIDKVNGETKTEINTKITEMLKYTQEVGKSADNLANAFRGDKKQQGNFGELRLKNLLEFYGFQENQDYYEQYLLKTKDEENNDEEKKKYPDFILQTQPNKWLVIDSKFSIANYQKYIETENIEEKQKYLKDYVNDLKCRIKELGNKEYNKLLKKNGMETFDFVCLFFGNEMAYITAISNAEHRDEIFQLSAKYKVAILTSSSFSPILQMIRQIWEMEKFSKNIYDAREIIDKWLKKTTSFQDNLEKVGKKIDEAKEIYDKAYGQLIDGKGSAISLANKVLQTIKEDKNTQIQEGNEDENKNIDEKLFLLNDTKDE